MKPILIVDDHQEILDFISLELDGLNVEFHTSLNVDNAIGYLKESEFSCIILDIIIDDSSSEKIIEFLRSNENGLNKDLPIILVSGHVDDEFIKRNEVKVYKILEKPFINGEISAIIKNMETQTQALL